MFEKIIVIFAYGSLLFAAAAAYLQLNKLWARKHLAEVAESISIAGILVESIPLLAFSVYFLWRGDMVGVIDSFIWLISAILVTMIGAGFWVKGQRKKGLFQLLKGSVARERGEISILAKELVSPSSAPLLIKVLTRMAAVDGKIDPREVALVQPFAEEWNLDIHWEEVDVETSSSSRILDTANAIVEYLDTTPPHTQAAHLLEVLQLLINADEKRSSEEQMAFDEISGQINQYLTDDPMQKTYSVVVAPQNEDQNRAINMMLKGLEEHTIAGGKGYTINKYFSRSYAELICTEYRALGFFTVVIED